MLSFEEALATVKDKLSGAGWRPYTGTVRLAEARGRVLAQEVRADRDYPPFNRATRDGFAVRSADLNSTPVSLTLIGQVRAGEHFEGEVLAGQCVEIMTGAPVPRGADAVVMVEHVRVAEGEVHFERRAEPFQNIVGQGSEAASGSVVLGPGRRLGAGEIGLLASVGKTSINVFARPRVAILPTGDEVVPIERQPEWFQVRNSNAAALAAQVEDAGGAPEFMGIAPDDKAALERLIEEGLKADLLLLSGGVSMGKYDFVGEVLSRLGAEFFFQGVAIRPGKPLVFGRARGKFFFALPGNPVSTFVTFELFARPAIAVLGGATLEHPLFLRARLRQPIRQKTGLTMFMPARVEREAEDPVVSLVGWQGSGDLVGVAAANCFLVVHPHQTDLSPGDWVDILPRGCD